LAASHLYTISLPGLYATGKHVILAIDNGGRLYWNGQLVVTEQRVRLQTWLNVAIVVGALGTVAYFCQ
jgi:hypothetical protein